MAFNNVGFGTITPGATSPSRDGVVLLPSRPPLGPVAYLSSSVPLHPLEADRQPEDVARQSLERHSRLVLAMGTGQPFRRQLPWNQATIPVAMSGFPSQLCVKE